MSQPQNPKSQLRHAYAGRGLAWHLRPPLGHDLRALYLQGRRPRSKQGLIFRLKTAPGAGLAFSYGEVFMSKFPIGDPVELLEV